jgi:predicted PurR-regulated permease PerM
MSGFEARNLLQRLSNLVLVRFLLLIACGWVIIQLLDYFQVVIVIFTFAAILSFLLSYPVKWLQRFLPHGLAVIVVFLVSIVILGGIAITVGLAVLSQGQQLVDSISIFLNSLVPLVEQVEKFLQSRNIQIDLSVIETQIREQAVSTLVTSLAILQGLVTNFITFILIAVVAFFMLMDGEKLWKLMLKIIPQQQRSKVTQVIKRNFLGFFRGQLLLTLFLTSATFIVFILLNVPFALLLSIIVGIVDVIPGIGATLGISIVSLIILSQNVWLALRVLGACIILQQIQDNLIAPRVMQGTLNLNPVVVFFAVLLGARVAGLLGIFISIPITGIIVSLLEIEEMKSDV